MVKFKNILKKGDLFGGQWGITFQGQDTYKTVVGFFCSLAYLAIIVIAFIVFWSDFRDKSNPTLSSEILIGEEFPELNFNDYSFFFSLSAIYEGRYLHYEEMTKIFSVNLHLVSEVINTETEALDVTETPSDVKLCEEADFTVDGKVITGGESLFSSDVALCPVSKNLAMRGHLEDPDYQYIRTQITPCTSNCWANLTTELEDVHITFAFVEASIVPGDYNNPFKYHMNKDYSFHLDERMEYFRKFFFRTLEVDTDKGLIMENIDPQKSLDVTNLIYEDGQRHTSTVPYLEIRVFSSNHNLFVHRTYVKLQDFLGNIGGVSSVAAIVIGILYMFYNDISLKLYIMNKTLFRHHVKMTGKKITFLNVMKFHLCSKLKCCKCFSEETKQLTQLYFSGEDQMDENMDVRNLVENSNDVKIIKEILFNKNQILLMDQVTNERLVKNAQEDDGESSDEEEKDPDPDVVLKAVEYLEKEGETDPVEKKINDFLRGEMEEHGIKKNLSMHSKKLKSLSSMVKNEGKVAPMPADESKIELKGSQRNISQTMKDEAHEKKVVGSIQEIDLGGVGENP